MSSKVWDLLARARQLEASVASRVEGAARQVAGVTDARPPIETVHAAIEAIAAEVQPIGRGRRGLPFNVAKVTFLAASPRTRAQLRAIVDGPPPFPARVHEALRAAGCAAPDVAVRVAYAPHAPAGWTAPDFHVDLAHRATHAAAAAVAAPVLRVEVIEGDATNGGYAFTSMPIAIGRGAEVRDPRQRLVRTNHVAFTGDGDAARSVSRRHARIERDDRTGRLRVIDEGSVHGTHVVRNGRGIPVPPGTRGVAIETGDEIVIGRARIRVALAATADPPANSD
jgi:hypothetical protein